MQRKKVILPVIMVILVVFVLSFGVSACKAPAAETTAAEATAAETTAAAAETTAAASGGEGLYKLTRQDVLDIYKSSSHIATFQNPSMDSAVAAGDPSTLTFTEEEKAKLKAMDLTVAYEFEDNDDAAKFELAGMQEIFNELGIKSGDIWYASEKSGGVQMADFENFLTVADNYDIFYCLPVDSAGAADILGQIMKKTHLVVSCVAPFGVDWNNENWIGTTDANGYLAGMYSAKAAYKILNGQGAIGTIGWELGRNGTVTTCENRYKGWDEVIKENPDVKIYQDWYDVPVKATDLIQSMLAAHPDVKVFLIDFANPPADQAQNIFKERGLVPYKDISMVTIDSDDTVAIPMATTGPDNNYCQAYAHQTWYQASKLRAAMVGKHFLYGNDVPKFFASDPLPLTIWGNLKENYNEGTPTAWVNPPEIQNLTGQFDSILDELGIDLGK